MKDWDVELYLALAHPLRRRIIECLEENALSLRELLERVGIDNHGELDPHMWMLKGLVERESSKKKYHLTDRGRLASELIWDIRFALARGVKGLSNEPARYVRRLKSGDHAVFYYDSEDGRREVVFPFLAAGLLKGEAVVYAVSEDKLDLEWREIQRYGITADSFRNGAFAMLSADEWFLKKGKAQPETIIDNWRKVTKKKHKAGFRGVRGAVEMNLFLDYDNERLQRLEVSLGRKFAFNLSGMCMYNTQKLDEEQFTKLEESHGHSILHGTAFKTT